jgi:hypothetical protein
MEDSQILALPPALAAEATQLRRNWETRNRQMMQERLLSQIESSATLSPVFRYNRSEFFALNKRVDSNLSLKRSGQHLKLYKKSCFF